MSSGGRVSIPSSVRRTIQNIKEITGNHSEEEIYAMLKECSMDPNETTQKLLFQDTFHEVKRKRDRRKENLNKEPAESRWKPGMQGRGNRIGRGNYSSRYVAHDGTCGRASASGKENGINKVSEQGVGQSTLPTSLEGKNKETTTIECSSVVMGSDPTFSGSASVVHGAHSSVGAVLNQLETSAAADSCKFEGTEPPLDANKSSNISVGSGGTHGQLVTSSSTVAASKTSATVTGVHLPDSDPVLVPSQDSRLPTAVGIRRELGNQKTAVEQTSFTAVSEGTSTHGKIISKSSGAGKTQNLESALATSSSHGSSGASRPSSGYSNRPQVMGPQKAAGPSKEWKPKSSNPILARGSGTALPSEVSTVSGDTNTRSQTVFNLLDSKEATSELQRKLEETCISDAQHVIIPNHLHVPEAEKLGFCFGSFDASLGLSSSLNSGPENDKSSVPYSETSEEIEEILEELPSSNQNTLVNADEGDYADHSHPSSHVPENISSMEGDVASNVVPETEFKQDSVLLPGSQQYSVVHTSPSYNFGFMPQMLGSQVAPFENSELQVRDASRLPSFIVQQPFDPASYYAQFYRSGADSDGRISPFHSAGAATKYNGNVAVLPPQTSQPPQEVGNPLVLPTSSPTPLVTQASGVMQSSMPVTQQPLPVFRQPAGMHLSHYPSSFLPYGPYISPFYVPSPTIHQFVSNGAYPQQPQAGSLYPATPAATAKFSLSQYKPGTNTGNMGMPGGYGPYGSSPAGYNPSSASTGSGNSTSNEDLTASQFKEGNVYVTAEQSEGSGVWIAAPGRDISGLQASSLYTFPQGQVAFTPTQAGHGPFAGIYHPAQPVTAATMHPLLQQSQTVAGAADMAGGPTGSVYQQPQHAQINWPSSY